MGLSNSTLKSGDSNDHFAEIVNPKKIIKTIVEEDDENAFASKPPNSSTSNNTYGGRCVALDSRASIIKKVEASLLWDNFLKGNYMSFALTQSEVTTLLKKSIKDANDGNMTDEAKVELDREIASYIELVEELSRKDLGNSKVVDFMAMCSSSLLLTPNTIEFKIDWLYLWITMTPNADVFDFKQFIVAMRSFERGLSHAMGTSAYSEEAVRNVARDWFALADPNHKGVSDDQCTITSDDFFDFCSNRQHVVRRLLESLGISEAKHDSNRDIQEAVLVHSEGIFDRKPTGGDEWMANPAWKKTAESMIPSGHNHISSKPGSNLELEWVHGYRGFDCRNNLSYLDEKGEQVFFHAAALGIIQCNNDINNSKSDDTRKQYFFGEHNDDIISLANFEGGTSDNSSRLLATGEIGKKPAVYLYEWDTQKKEFRSLTSMRGFHTRGVCQITFSHDGTSLFTVGVDYTIAIYDCNKCSSKFGKMLGSSKGPKDKVLHCTSLQNGNFVSCGEKHISYWNIISGRIQQNEVKLRSHKRKLIMCVGSLRDDYYIAGTSDGDILMFKQDKLLDDKKCILKAHKKSINSLWVHPSGSVFVSGDSTGKVIVWHIITENAIPIVKPFGNFVITGSNYGKLTPNAKESRVPPIRSICLSEDMKKCLVGTQASEIIEYTLTTNNGNFFDMPVKQDLVSSKIILCGHYKDELWGLGIRPRGRLDTSDDYRPEYCTVGDDGILCVWDLFSHKPKTFRDMEAPARCCAYSPDGQYLAVGFGGSIGNRKSKHSGAVRIYRGDTLLQVCELKEAKQWISAIKFSPDGSVLAVGARDNSVYMYSVAQQFRRKSKFSKHNAGILDFDFTNDGKYLQSTCSAYEILFSNTNSGAQLANGASFLSDEEWATYTCTLGWPVIGIWSGSMDGSDVNSADRSPSGKLIATGDDFGKVNCYMFPCTIDGGAPKNAYAGHSSHVTNVRWVSLSAYGKKKTDDFLISLGGNDKTIMQWKVISSESHGVNSESNAVAVDVHDSSIALLEDGPTGGDEFMATKAWLGAIRAPSAWVSPDVAKKAPFYAALGDMGSKHRTLRVETDTNTTFAPVFERNSLGKVDASHFGKSLETIQKVYSEVQSSAATVMQKMSLSGEDNAAQPDGDELELEWVHGFTADFNNRNNVHYVYTGGACDANKRWVVYPAAGLGILAEITCKGYDQTALSNVKQRYFRGHTDDISSISTRDLATDEQGSKQSIVATGQMGKGNTFVWEVPSMKTLAILKTGQKTVTSLEFSKSDGGRLLISISKDGYVCVCDWKSQSIIARVQDNSASSTYHCCASSITNSLSFVTCGDKTMKIWNLNGRNLSSNKIVVGNVGRGISGLKYLCCAELNGIFFLGCENGMVYTTSSDGKKLTQSFAVNSVSESNAGTLRKRGKRNGSSSISKNHVLSMYADDGTNTLLVGSKDGMISIFEISESKVPIFLKAIDIRRPEILPNVSAPQVHSISCFNDKILFSTRGADICEYDYNSQLGAIAITRGHCYGELWGLATHPSLPEYCTTGDDMTLRTFSVVTRGMLSVTSLGAPARACDYNHDGSLIAVGFGGRLGRGKEPKGGMVRLYRGNCAGAEIPHQNENGCNFFEQNHFKNDKNAVSEVLAQSHDAKQWVSVVRFSADGHTLAVGAHDCKIYIYDVTLEEDLAATSDGFRVAKSATLSLRCTFRKHNSVINHLDLSTNGRYMQSNCSAYELLFSDTSNGKQITSASELKDVSWDSWTCTLGWPVQGVWVTGMDGSDINTVARSSSGHLVATGDDFGKIRLFRYPSIQNHAHSLAYSGHSSHVMNVKWSAADECLISCGGNDKCIMQWKHVMNEGTSGAENRTSDKMSIFDESMDNTEFTRNELQMGSPSGGDESGAVKPWLGAVRTPKIAPPIDNSNPAISMNLQWVHGYTCGSTCNTRVSKNLWYASDGNPVYPAAALGVKLIKSQTGGSPSQQFYRGHNDDILCMAVDPERRYVATGQVASKSSRGKGSISIWDSRDCRELFRMNGCHQRGVTSLAFSPDGTQLISVGQDNKNTHKLWTDVGGNWCRVQCTATATSDQSTVFFSQWLQGNHKSQCALVSGGAKSINFWQIEGATLVKKQGRFGRKYKQSPLLCAANLQTSDEKGGSKTWCIIVGTASGSLFSFDDRDVSAGIEKAHNGPVLCLAEGNKECSYLVSGGKDHSVRVWNQALQPISSFDVSKLCISDASIASLDVRPFVDGYGSLNNDLVFLVGTTGGDIIELSVSPSNKSNDVDKAALDISNAHENVLMTSHCKGELWGLAVHPTNPDIFATVGDDSTLRIWNIKKNKMISHVILPHAARSVAWAVLPQVDAVHRSIGADAADDPPKEVIAVGFMEADSHNHRGKTNKAGDRRKKSAKKSPHSSLHLYKVEVVKNNYELELIAQGSPTDAWVGSLQFSPVWINIDEDGSEAPSTIRIGAGCHDKNLYLYDLPNPWDKNSLSMTEESWEDVFDAPDYIFKKHSSAVINFDFNGNGTAFQSTCQAGELLYGAFQNGKVIQKTSATEMAQYNGVREDDSDPNFWFSQTCTLGWPVQGIWPPGADTSDINACDRSPKGDLLATVDDYGLVKVFRYPAVADVSKHLEFTGHSSHATNVRWTTGEHLISTGGNDKCVFIWECVRE